MHALRSTTAPVRGSPALSNACTYMRVYTHRYTHACIYAGEISLVLSWNHTSLFPRSLNRRFCTSDRFPCTYATQTHEYLPRKMPLSVPPRYRRSRQQIWRTLQMCVWVCMCVYMYVCGAAALGICQSSKCDETACIWCIRTCVYACIHVSHTSGQQRWRMLAFGRV